MRVNSNATDGSFRVVTSGVTAVEVRSAQIAQLYAQVRAGMVATLVAAFALAALLWSIIPHDRILVWLGVFLAVQAPRHVLLQRFRSIEPKGSEALPWGSWFLLGSSATALLYGMSAVLMFPVDSFVHQCILACFLGGFAAATAVAHAPLTECYVSSVLLALGPVLGRFLYQGGEAGLVLSMAGLAFAAALLAMGKAVNRLVADSIRLGFEKDNLLNEVSTSRANLQQAVLDRTAELSAKNRELAQEIEQRREIESKLRQSEDHYRSLFSSSRDAIDIVTEDGMLVDFNQAFLDLFGYSAEEMRSMKGDRLWAHADDRRAWLHRLNEQGYLVDHPMKTRRKDGEIRDCVLTSTARSLPNGSVHYQSMCRDVTEQMRAQRAIQESEEKLRDIVELLPEPVFEVDIEGKITFASAKGFELFGYAREDIDRGLHMSQVTAAYDLERAVHNTQRVLQGELLGGIDYTAIRKDGSAFPIFVHSLPIRRGDVVTGVRGIIVDMTARKEAEEALKRVESLYRSVIDNIEDVFYRSDAQGNLLMGSTSGARLFGYDTVEEMIGTPLDSFWVDPEECQRLIGQLRKCGSVEDFEAVLKRKDGSTFVASFTTHFYRDESGTVQGTQGIIRDITSRKEAEQKLLLSEARLRQIIDLVPHFIFAKDIDGKFILVNQAVAEAYGTTVHALVGKKDEDFSHADGEVLHFQSDDMAVIKSGRPKVIPEEQITDANHNLRWLSTVKIPFTFSGAAAPSVLGVSVDITERKEAEEALRASEERLRLAWETSPDALSISRLEDGTYVDVNEGYIFTTGYTKEEVIGKSALDLPLWADPRDWQLFAAHLRQHGHIRNFETRLRRKDGETRAILVSAGLMTLSGEPLLLGVTNDIEDLKRAEVALRESEQKYRLLAENVSDVIWTADPNLRFSYMSPSGERMYGWDASDWLTFQPPDYLTPASLGLVLKVLGEERAFTAPPGLNRSRIKTLELEQLRKDGTSFWTEVSARFLYDDTGTLASIIGVTRDITERRRSQEQLQRLFAAIQQAGETIMITEPDGTILYANPAFEKTTGYPVKEAMGQTAAILKSGKHNQPFYEDMRSTIRRGEVWRGRFTGKHRDGSVYEEAATISPIKDESGQVVYYVMVGRDVTLETMLQKQLNQAQKMEAIGTLAGGIAHDFNNLLQAILGYGDLLLMNKRKDDPERKKLEIIQQAARDGADLVSRILTVSRKADSKARPMDLNEAIRKALKLLRRTIPRMIDIKLALDKDLKIIDADPGQVEQVLLNLAVNAQQAMPDGGQLLIETSNVSLNDEYLRTHLGAKPGYHVLLMVSDSGVGIQPDLIDRIFEPFFTTKINGEGTGLGLAMVHGIVSQHGGYVRCYSEPGRGASFKIYFPVSATELIANPTVTRDMPAFGSETVLLVDDDDRIRDMAHQLIKMGGYHVLAARSGEEALDIYAAHGADISLVILDLIMPGMGGRRCLEELLRIDPAARVLVASGYSSNGISQEEKGRGARGFISKPYDAKSILSAIRKVLDSGHL